MKKPSNLLLFLPGPNRNMVAKFVARTACRPQNRLGLQNGQAEIYAGGTEYGGRIFWGDGLVGCGGGYVARWEKATLLTALKWIMGVYVRAFDTCRKCRGER